MEDLTDLINYFKKLKRVVVRDIDFKFLNNSFIKKNKIDDVLCCILASLPNVYKRNMNSDLGKNLSSIIAYKHLFDSIKKKCPFNSDMYMIQSTDANMSINIILKTIEKDIIYLEKNS